MNAAALLLPFLLVRFGLMALLDRRALRRAAHFAPLRGGERAAYVVYQASNLCIFLGLAFCAVEFDRSLWFCAGLACYALGLCLCAAAVVAFARPDGAGMSARGVYRLSRNPMYVSYFFCFAGMALLARSLPLLGAVLVFQVSAHWIIRSEKRWCLEQFPEAYARYMRAVRRYL